MLRSAAALLVVASAYVFAVGSAESFSSGAPTGFAGDVLDGGTVRTCTACHGVPSGGDPGGGVDVDAPASVAPGETVRITVTVDNRTPAASAGSRRQGFQAVVKDADTGEAVGRTTLVDAGTRFAGARAQDTVYVTHTSAGTAQTSWAFDWTAPAEDAPDAYRVYAAGNAANGNGTSSGDYVYTATADVASASVSTAPAPEAVRFDLAAPWPNPAAGSGARTEAALDVPGVLVVTLVDGRGRHVRTAASGARPAGRHAVALDVEGLAPGLYFVVADGPGGRRTHPLAVVR